MKKICPVCSTVFAGNAADSKCPIYDCEPVRLIVVDDIFVDIVKKFLEFDIAISCAQAGTLDPRSNGPHVCFTNAFHDESLLPFSDFREAVVEAGGDCVSVSDVDQGEYFDSVTVFAMNASAESSAKEKLHVLNEFVEALYDMLDEFEGLLIEAGCMDEKLPCNGEESIVSE